jgi:hypothetical protein
MTDQTIEMPKSLDGWKAHFRTQIDEARRSDLSEAAREALIDYVREEAEMIFFGWWPPAHDSAPAPTEADCGPWWDR